MTPVVIGNATLYQGRALNVRASFGPVDALIGDPPYGQGYKVNTTVYEPIEGDDEPFDPAPWIDYAPIVMLWGAHKFADRLPSGRWLVWDKVPTGKLRDQGDGEAAWINDDRPMRIFRLLWDGLCVGKGARHEVTAGQKRYHPMQKPEMLMRWCIEQAGTPKRILNPWMGSGSTGVAAMQMGLSFVGCEVSPVHFDIACRRIEDAQRQAPIIPHEQPKQVQQELA